MSAAAYAQWLERGRRHQQEQRPLDAIQCYRRALREAPQPDAAFHLGEALWQLGRLDEAMRTWNDAMRAHPAFLPVAQALAEAALGRGDSGTARAAADQVLAQTPDDRHAQGVRAVAALLDDDTRDEGLAGLTGILDTGMGVLRRPAVAASLAVAMERAPDDALLGRIARAERLATDAPTRLIAVVCEHLARTRRAGTAWFDAVLARPLAIDDHDALRRIARAAQVSQAPSAAALTSTYCALCATAFASVMPLLWPARTAGARVRIVLLAGGGAAARAAALAVALAEDAQVWLATLDGEAPPVPPGVASLSLGMAPSAAEARLLAALDADLLVDLIGLDAATGPLLAQRPARRIVSVGSLRAPLSPPLVDAIVPDDARALLEAAKAVASSSSGGTGKPIADGVAAGPDATTLDATWRDAVAAHQAGEAEVASRGYAEVLAAQPSFAPAHYLTGVLARDGGDAAAARRAFARAIALVPGYHEARAAALAAAAAARDTGDVGTLAAAIPPAAPATLWRAAGHAWLTLGDGARAAAAFDRALALEPSDAETHYNRGVALQLTRDYPEAARAYQRAVTCRPEMIAADFNLGVLFTETGNRDAAIAAFSTVLRANPTHVSAHKYLCEALLAAGRIDEWLAAFRRFEAQCPSALPMAVHALEACHYAGDFVGVERYLEGLRQERFVAGSDAELADALEQLLYVLLYFDVEASLLLRFAETYDRTAAHVYGTPLPARGERTPGRTRVGYLSADLRNHVMGKMMYQAIARHDRTRFDIRLYALSPQRDEWTTRFAAAADALVPLAALDDARAVARIAADDLDILVDLNTHTRGARPGILARRPARVQVTHVASAGVLGLRAIDFKLTDHFADVPENAATQVEPLLAMDGCVYPYRHIEPARGAAPSRGALRIDADAFVLGAFVNPLKLSRRCLTLWREVLARVPHAVLAFSPLDAGLRDVYLRLCAATGIAADRVRFVPASADEQVNQARYAIVDAVLDPMPFGGVNGTLEALDAGVPVVTLLGKRHGERTSYSILANLGVTDTVAHSGPEYVELAVRLAEDRAFNERVRAAIRTGLSASPLVDLDAHARNLERAYEEALARRADQPAPTLAT